MFRAIVVAATLAAPERALASLRGGSSSTVTRAAVPTYVPGKDHLQLHYDHAPDPDDGQSCVMDRAILEARYGCGDNFVSKTLKVTGTYGWNMRFNGGDTFRPESYAVMNEAWNDCGGYLDAHNDWSGSVKTSAAKWVAIIKKGRKIFIKEGGMADFTAAVIRYIFANYKSLDFWPDEQVVVVQHSEWNEDESTQEDLEYVKATALYVKIDDANEYLRVQSPLFYDIFKASALASKWGDAWDEAFRYYTEAWHADVVDVSDTGELEYILGMGEADTIELKEKYLDPAASSSAPTCRYAIDGDPGTDKGKCEATNVYPDLDGSPDEVVLRESEVAAGARCCNGASGASACGGVPCQLYSFEDAREMCQSKGAGWDLCTKSEYEANKNVVGSGCSYDHALVWTLTSARCEADDTLTLIDAEANRDITLIEGGAKITEYENVNIRADFLDASVASVQFKLNGAVKQTENLAPFTLYGDVGGLYNEGTLPLGRLEIVATAYAGKSASGGKIATVKRTVTVAEPEPEEPSDKCFYILDGNPKSDKVQCEETNVYPDIDGPDLAVAAATDAVAGTRCCNGKLAESVCWRGCALVTFAEAERFCEGLGSGWGVCSRSQIESGMAASKDCGYDNAMVWTTDEEKCSYVAPRPTPQPTPRPTSGPKCRYVVDGNPTSDRDTCSATSVFSDRGEDYAVAFESEAVAGARCCNGKLGTSVCDGACSLFTFAEARSQCRAIGSGWDLCTKDEYESNSNVRGSGCNYDFAMVWTLTKEDCALATPPSCDYEPTFVEEDGLVVIEAESLPYACAEPADWEFVADTSGDVTGRGYIKYTGPNNFGKPVGARMSVLVDISSKGTWKFVWHSFIEGTHNTEENDSWLKIEADDFYGNRGDLGKHYPKGVPETPKVNGASDQGFLKIYRNGNPAVWRMDARTSDHEYLFVYADFDAPGTYKLTVAGRSYGHYIDRLVLYHLGTYEDKDSQAIFLSHPETRA